MLVSKFHSIKILLSKKPDSIYLHQNENLSWSCVDGKGLTKSTSKPVEIFLLIFMSSELSPHRTSTRRGLDTSQSWVTG